MKFRLKRILASVAIALTGSSMASANLILDTFERGGVAATDPGYAVVNDGTPNGTVQFGFDYVAAGLPLAPRSAPGEGRGLRLTANDSLAAVDAYTVFNNTAVTGNYKLTVDVFMGFGVLTSSTEHAHVGVGGNGTTFNSIFTPVSGSGAYIAFTGDGGSGSDYRWFRSVANSSADNPAAPGVVQSTTLANSHPSYLGRGSDGGTAASNGGTGTFFTNTLFPAGKVAGAVGGPSVLGSPSNIWTTVEVTVDSGTISFAFDGIETYRGGYTGTLDGLVSLGLADTFTSVDTGHVFTLYDNLTVTAVPEPSSVALVGLGVIGVVARRRQLANRKLAS